MHLMDNKQIFNKRNNEFTALEDIINAMCFKCSLRNVF